MKKIIACALLLVALFTITACGKKQYSETTQIDNGEVKMIAHRGLSGLEVENTDEAFILAGKHSYYGIESDVRRTADGKFVMCHDDTLESIAGKEIEVEKTTLAELLKVPLNSKHPELSYVPNLATLESYILICKEYDKQAILELKSNFTEPEIVEMVAIIGTLGYLDRVTFISFNYDNLLFVRKASPSQKAMFLFSELSDETTSKLIKDHFDVAIYHKALTKKAVQEFHSAGLEVNVWTVDGESLATKLMDWGVDYITTNILE
jgi:glycerophosphoryl diester phosphodiesterase